jgi:deoxyribodipyrimidine photolyase
MGNWETMRFFFTQVQELAQRQLQDQGGYSTLESTLILQVLVHCNEKFCVKDVTTDQVVQGHADKKVRSVSHLVRLERVVTHIFLDNRGPSGVELGSWQITDWDDLLEGNIWFL